MSEAIDTAEVRAGLPCSGDPQCSRCRTQRALRDEVDRLRASERTAWDVHSEHVETMNRLLLHEQSLRDEARAALDRVRTLVHDLTFQPSHAVQAWRILDAIDNPESPRAAP